MILKITLNSIKTIVCSCIIALTFLFSLTINSQEVGQEYLVNPGINTTNAATSSTPETGVEDEGCA